MTAIFENKNPACAGFGLGLRTTHYADFLSNKQPLDWLEIITDNYLVEGGKPLVMLDTIRRDYPVAMHGVAMSLGAADGVDMAYLRQVKQLADRVEPLWISDHLCWIGQGSAQLHDLYPLPYTDEAARHVVTQIRRAQDVLQRKLVLENVSSYIDFQASCASEWDFLSYIAQEADCLLLVDVNNIFVSSVNHGFDPLLYLRGLPAHRVQQIHLAGHSDMGDHVIDTHDHPVAPAVWDLYAQACCLFGPVAAMIERDDNIPALSVLLDELSQARQIASAHWAQAPHLDYASHVSHAAEAPKSQKAPQIAGHAEPGLQRIQTLVAQAILAPRAALDAPASTSIASEPTLENTLKDTPEDAVLALLRVQPGVQARQRWGIYHHAYRARLAEVLADSFVKTHRFMGSDAFDVHARDYAVAHPPLVRSLNRYGQDFAAYLKQLYPSNPELHELAQLDADLRFCFDGPDVPVLDATSAQQDAQAAWLSRAPILHPSVQLRAVHTNAVALWKAIDADEDVPAPTWQEQPGTLMVWRQGLQPHFQSLAAAPARLLAHLLAGHSIHSACAEVAQSEGALDPQQLGLWLRDWLDQGVLRGTLAS